MDDLNILFTRFADDEPGATDALYMWGYSMWTRAHHLRDLAGDFRRIGVIDQDRLRSWATRSQFGRGFEGRVKGPGITVYHRSVMEL